MSKPIRILAAVVFVLVIAGLLALLQTRSPPRGAAGASPRIEADGTIVVPLESCDAQRPGQIRGMADIATIMLTGFPVDRLTHRGTITVDDGDFALYLPEAKEWSLENRGNGDDDLSNKSTRLSIDANGDGALTADESWYANLPVRIGDRMFDVVAIAADGGSVSLKPSSSPLHGLIVGRRVPPFQFTTSDGRSISDETLAGRPCVLDVWGVT